MIRFMKLSSKLQNSAFVAFINLLLAVVAFIGFVYPRFSNWGFGLVRVIAVLLVVTCCLFLRDLWRSGTRGRAALAFCLSLPIVFLFGELTVWEGPLYVSAKPTTPLTFQVRGPAGFWGLKILRQASEMAGDNAELVWQIDWTNVRRFPPMQLEFSYGVPPPGFQGWTAPPPLDPNATYTLIVKPAMGINRCYSVHGGRIAEYDPYPTIAKSDPI
jgi:hypothetical protein